MGNNNQWKRQTLKEISDLVDAINVKINILNALDRDASTSGCFDIVDQITALQAHIDSLTHIVARALAVVPTSGSLADIDSKF